MIHVHIFHYHKEERKDEVAYYNYINRIQKDTQGRNLCPLLSPTCNGTCFNCYGYSFFTKVKLHNYTF